MSFEPTPAAARGFLTPDAPPALFSAALAEAPGVRHAFFGRRGGVSGGLYASLNAGPGSRDDPAAVSENRRRIAAAFGLAPERLIGVHQIHSPIAHEAHAPWPGPRPDGDALVTATPGLLLSVLTADCAPVLLADAEAGVIGAAHAGWKGAHGGVLEAALAKMQALGARANRIVAAIGPCIRQASYEVGPEFAARFEPWEREHFFRAANGDRLRFDLPAYCVARLQRSGVNRIDAIAADTYANAETLFSHRRSVHEKAEDYGRNCAALALSQK